MKLIVGLGNPGSKYEGVRHNLGFMAIDKFADRIKNQESSWKYKEKLKSEIMQLNLIHDSNSLQLILAKPQTYINNSGLSVNLLASYYKLSVADVIVVYDELDLPLGKIKVRMGGAAAGHHGVESIIKALNDDQFVRIRLGIGDLKTQSAAHKSQHVNVEKYVLETFRPDEKSKVKHMLKQAVQALEMVVKEGLAKAQNQFH